ncbi:MAG: hypothetical protein WBB85_02340 [Albidovulum sp.]|uniref:hypothetical protein n=1 Tax=Albidovulum sp. TaxID=1872424 RepID=UPI003CBB4599
MFEDVPGALLATLVPRAPLDWLAEGTISARVEDEWTRDDRTIDMDWSITTRDLQVRAPERAGMVEKLAVGSLGKVLASRGGDAEFHFTLDLDRDRLETSSSGDMAALWDAVKDGLAMAVAQHTGEAKVKVKDKVGKVGQSLHDLIDPATGDKATAEP